MDGRRDFTLGQDFVDLPQLVEDVKKDGLRFIVIVDPAIASDYPTYDRGVTGGVFVKWANSSSKPDNQPTDSDIVLGNVKPHSDLIKMYYLLTYLFNIVCHVLFKVWPDSRTAFPDFFKDSTQDWWTNEFKLFYNMLKFDAIWIVSKMFVFKLVVEENKHLASCRT